MARDPLGIKPLYCGDESGNFYFSSEIKSMMLVTNKIHEFPSGHWFHSQKGWHAYYEIDASPLEMQDKQQATAAIHATITKAVNMRMIADVPVGISLSGGLG